MWYFCPALDAFQVELGADIRDAFLSPSKQTVPLQSDVALPLLHAYDLPLSPLPSPTPSSASIAHSPTHDHPERRASASSSDDSGLGDDIDNDDDNGLDETLSGEPPTTGRWTKKEHELFLEGLRRYGKSWKSISNLVVSRTLVQIRTHAQKYLQKQSRSSKTGAAYQYLAGNQPPSRHHTFHHQQAQSTLPHHLAMSSFFMPHQQQQLRWPVPPAFQNDAIYRQLILANQQHLSTTSNNVIDELLDHSDDDNENADDGNQPNNHDEWDDDDDNELQHMMMGCETSGDKRRSSAPAISSSLKPLAPSVGFKRRRLDETGTAYLDPAVSYSGIFFTPSIFLSSDDQLVMISGLFLISQKGEVVLNRLYRDDVSRRAADAFRLQVIAAKETGSLPPIKSIDGCSFLYTRHENLYLVAVSRANINTGHMVALVFQFLTNINGIFQDYMGKKYNEVDVYKSAFDPHMSSLQESIRNNFTLVYELLDETMDYGYPQNCARREGIKYKRNEVYLDVFESVNLLMSANGAVLRNEVVGQVVMKTLLTGMPECKIDDCTFHRCVRLGKFDADRTITFIPPDGEFELMKYRVTENINLPFKIMPAYQEGSSTRMAVSLKIAATFSARLFATNIVIKIPVPQNTARCKIIVPIGTAKHAPEHHAIVWKIRKFQGTLERMLDAEIEMLKGTKEKVWSRPPIQVEFQVPMFTSSGLHVRFLKVFEKSSYQTTKWVRYVSRAGQYQLRI
ncbi:hypothetical protein DYB37_000642 [Aphanomyces astaci]|uniref:MHD domain-containing protein n=2 Tax=Aphanomyces astaci TaxID=112090 RepID=A0A3R6YAC8_APHAT|nr:hypothetical protein DYB37_000642 [Aphanomyces astaci]